MLPRFVRKRLRDMQLGSLLPVDWILAVRPLHRPRWVCPLDKNASSTAVVAGSSEVGYKGTHMLAVERTRNVIQKSSSIEVFSLKSPDAQTEVRQKGMEDGV
jgi:hypothetical protein